MVPALVISSGVRRPEGPRNPEQRRLLRLADRHRAARRVWNIHPSAPHHPGRCGERAPPGAERSKCAPV